MSKMKRKAEPVQWDENPPADLLDAEIEAAQRARTPPPPSPRVKFQEARKALKDALVERDQEVDLVLTGMLAREHVLLVGPPGCLRGDVPIHDPVDGTTKTVRERWKEGKDFHVTAWDHTTNRPVVTKAEAPWKYPTAPMVELVLSDGDKFTVTYGHRLWDGRQYVAASAVCESLQGSGAFPLPTTPDTCPPASHASARHSSRTLADSSAGRRSDHHSCGGRPHQDEDVVPASSPSQDGCDGRNPPYSPPDDLVGAKKPGRHDHKRYPRSKTGLALLTGLPTETKSAPPSDADTPAHSACSFSARTPSWRSHAVSGTSQQLEGPSRLPTLVDASFALNPAPESGAVPPRSSEGFAAHSRLRNELESPWAGYPTEPAERQPRPQVVSYETFTDLLTNTGRTNQKDILPKAVVSARPVSAEPYYDFHVPIYNNYVAVGVIHHNTAKSALCDSVVRWLGGVPSFSILFNKFTVPEEVLGPVSVKGLKEDVYRRVTTGKLPEAVVAFGDEVWKASPAILNVLLRIVNERVFDNGDGVFRPVPLQFFLAASNEWPQEQQELGALFDRFLFRKRVKPVSANGGRKALLKRAVDNDPCRAHVEGEMSVKELEQAQTEAKVLPWSNGAKKALWEILETLTKEGIVPGDRRQMKAVTAARASAYLEGADKVQPPHLEVLSHVLWDDPESSDKCAKVVLKIANPTGAKVTDLLVQAEDVVANQKPVEAVPKLESIQKELETMGTDPRVTQALNHVLALRKSCYHAAIGIKEEE